MFQVDRYGIKEDTIYPIVLLYEHEGMTQCHFNIKMLTIVLILILMRIYFMLNRVLNGKKDITQFGPWTSFQK